MTEIALVALAAYLLFVAALFVFQRSMMYHPGAALPPPDATAVADAEVRVLETEPGLRSTSWFLPPAGDAPVVVFFQGNAATIAERDFKARAFAAMGYGVWLTGYRGFGGNPGSPTEAGLYADARAALAALAAEGVGPGRIVLYGESLGSGVATQMAHELAAAGTPVAALILEAPFASMGRAAQDHYPFVPAVWLVRDRFDNLAKIDAVSAPVLIMHGARDRVVRQKHGTWLFEAAREPKKGFWPDGAAHADLHGFGAFEQMEAFLAEHLGR